MSLRGNSLIWGKKPVEIEWKSVELFISRIAMKCSKLFPPYHSSVFGRFFDFKRIVKENRHDQSNRWRWREYCVNKLIELKDAYNIDVSWMNQNVNLLSWLIKHTHRPLVLTGPWPVANRVLLKYWGMDIPSSSDKPTIVRFRIEFMFVNWSSEIPVDAVLWKEFHHINFQIWNMKVF